MALSCGFQTPTFRHPRLGPADEERIFVSRSEGVRLFLGPRRDFSGLARTCLVVRPEKWDDSQVGFRGNNASGGRIVLPPEEEKRIGNIAKRRLLVKPYGPEIQTEFCHDF